MNASISSFLYGILSPLVLASAGPEQKPDDQKDASANPAYSPVLQCLPQVEMVNPPKPGVLQDAREQWLLDNWLTGKDYSFDSLNADIVAINSGKGTLQIVYKMSPDGKKIEKAVVYLIQNQPIPGCPQQERVEAQELALWDKKQEIASWEAGKAPDKSVPLVAYLQEILRPFGLLPGEYKPGVMDAATINALQNMVYSRASALPEDPKLPLMILREKRAEMHAKTGRLERYEAGKEPGHDHQFFVNVNQAVNGYMRLLQYAYDQKRRFESVKIDATQYPEKVKELEALKREADSIIAECEQALSPQSHWIQILFGTPGKPGLFEGELEILERKKEYLAVKRGEMLESPNNPKKKEEFNQYYQSVRGYYVEILQGLNDYRTFFALAGGGKQAMETVDGLIKKTMLDNTEEFGTLELSFASHWNQTRSNTLYAHADQLGSLQEDPDFISAEVRSGLLTVRQTLGNELSAESIKELKTKKETEIVPAFRQVEEMSHQLFLVYGWIETAEYNLEGKPELVELQPKLNEGRCDISGGPACTVPGSTPLFNELEASLKKLSEVDLVQKHLKALQEMLEGIQDPKAQALLAKIKGGTFSFADYAGLVSLLKEKGLSDQAKKDAGLALEFLRVTGNVALRRAKCNEKGAARKFVEDNLRKEYSAALFLLDYFDKLPSVKSMPTAKKRMLRQIVLQVLLEYAKGVKKDKKGKLTLADLPAVIKKAESFLKRAGTAADQTIPACDSDPKTEHSICEIHYLLNKKGEQGVETESTEKIKALLGTEISEDYDNFIAWGYSNNDAYKSENDGLSLAADMIYVPMRFYNDSVSAEEQISVEEVLMVLGQMAQDPTILGFESAVLKGGVNLIFRVSEEDNAAKAEFSSELTRQVLQRLVLRKGLSLDQSMVISPTQIMEGKRQHMEAQTSPVFNTFKQLFEWSALGGYEGFYGLGSGVAKDANTGIPLGVDTPLSMLYGMGSIILVYLNQIGESALAKKVQDYINDPVKNPLSPKDFIDLLVALRKSSAHQDAIEETAKILAASSQAALEFPNPVETVFQVTTNELQPYILVPPENFEGNGLDALSFRDRMDTKLPQHQGYVAKDIEVKDFVTRYRIGLLNMSLVGNAQAPDLALFQSQGWSTNEIPWFAMQAYVKKYGGVSVFRYRDGLEPSFTAPQKSLLDQVLASRAFLGDRKAVLHALLQKVMAGNLALSPEEEQKLPELLSAVEAGLKAVSGEKALNGESAALLLILQKALSNKGLVEVAEFQYRFGAPVLTGEQRAVLQSLLKNPLHLTAKDQALLRKIVNDEQRFYADEVDDQYLKGFFDRLSAEGAGLPWDQKVRFDNALLALRSDFSRDRMNYKPGLNANEQRVLSELAVLMKDNNLVIEDYSLDGIDPKATFKENKARIPQEMLKAIKNPADRERFIALYIQAIPMLKQLAQEVALTVPKMEQTDYSRYDLSFTDPIRSLSDIKKLLNHGFVKGMLEAANPPSAADAKMFQMQGKESMGLLLYLLAKDEEVCTAVTGGRPECKDGKILEAYSADLARLNAIEAEIQAHVTTVSGGLLGNISGAYDQVVALSEDMTYETEYKKIITVTDDQGRPKETVSEPEKKPAAGLGAILKLLNKLIDDTKCTDDQKKIFNCDAQRDGYKSDRSFYQFIGNGMSQIDGFVKGFKESGITMLVGLEGFETNLTVLVDGFVRTELSGVVQFPFVVPKDMKAIIQAVQDSLNLVKGVAGKEKEARKLEYALTFLKACQQVFEQIPLLKAERESLITVTEERAATRKKVVDINTYITGDSFGERETSALLRLTGLDDQGVVQQELASFIDEEHNRVYDLNGMPMPQTAVEILKDYCIKNKGQVLMTARVTPGSHDWKVKMALRAVLDMVPQVTKIDYVNFGMNFLFTTSAASHGFIDPFVLTTAAAEGYAPDLLVGKEQWEAKTAIMRNPVTYLISKTAATVGMMSETNQPYPMTHEAYMLLTEFDEDPDFLGNRLKDNVATDPTAGSFLHEFNATAVTYLGSFVEKKMKLAIDNDPLIRKAVMELNSNNQFYFLRFDAEGRLTAESMQEVKGLVAALAADGVEFEVWDAVSARTRFEVMAKEKKWTPEQVDRMVTFCKLVEDIFKVIGKKNELAGLFTPNSSPSTYLDLLEVTRVGMGLAKKPERLPGTVVSAPAQGEQEFAVYGELSATDKLMMDKYIEDIIPAGQGVMHWVDEYLKKAEKNPAMAFGSALYGFAKGYARTVKDLRFMMPKNIAMGFVSFWKGVFFTIDNLIAGHYQEIRQRVAQISEELGKTSGSFLTYELAGIIFALDFLEKLKKGEVPEAVGSSFIIYQFVKGSIQGMEGAVINTANLLIPRLSNIFNLGWNIAAKASGGRISPILYRSGWGTLQGFGNPEVQMGLGQKITYYVFGFGWLIDVVAEAAGGFQWTRAAASNLKWSLGGGALLVGVDEMGRQMTAVNPAERSALADGNLRGTLNNGWLGKSAGAKLWLTKGAVLFGSIPGGTVRVGVNFLGRFNPGAVGRAFDRGEVSLENSGLADFYAGLTDAEKTELVQEGVEIRSEGILINGKPLSQWQTMFFMWSKRPNKEFRLTFSRLKTGQSIFLLERTAKGVLEVGSDGIIGNEAEVDLTSDPNETINLEYLEAEYTRVKGDLQWIKNQIKQLKAERSAEPDKAKQAELTKKIRQLRLGKLKVQKSAKSLSRALASISEIPVNGAFMLKVTEALFEYGNGNESKARSIIAKAIKEYNSNHPTNKMGLRLLTINKFIGTMFNMFGAKDWKAEWTAITTELNEVKGAVKKAEGRVGFDDTFNFENELNDWARSADAMLRVYDIRVPSGEPEVDPTTGEVRQPTEVQTLSGKQLVWILDKKFDKAGVSKARGEFVLGILLQPGNKPAGYDGHMQQIKMHLAALYFITLNSSFDLEYEMTRWASGKDLDKTYKFKVLNEKTGKTETVERKGRILKANIERNVEGTQTATDQDASLTNSLVGNRNPDNLRGYLDGTTQKTEKGPTLFDRQIEALNMYEAFARSHGLESVVRGLEYLSKGAPLIGGPSGRVGAVGVRTGSDALSGFVVGMAIGLFNELTDDKPGVNWWGKHGVMSKAGESAFEWGRFGAIAGSSEVFLGWSKWAGMGAGLAFPTMLQLANSKTPDSAKGQILANGVAGGAGLAGGMGLLEIPGVARIKKIPFVGGILGTAIAIGAALGLGKVNEWAYNKFEGYRDVVDSRFMRGLGSSIGEGSHLSFVSWGAGALKGFTTSFSALNNLTESLLTETGFTATGAVAGGTGFWGGARAGLKAFMKPTVGASGLLGAFGAVTGGAALAQMGIEAWFQISNGEYEQSMAQRIGSQIYDHFYDSGEIGPNWIIKVIGGDGKFDQVLENSAKYYDDFSILDQRAITQRTSRVLGKDFDMSLDSADAVVDFYSSAMLGSGSTYANAGELAAGIEIEATALTSEVYFTPQERAMFQAVIKFASNNKIGSLDDPRLVDTLLSTDVTDLDVLAWLKDTTVDKGCNSDGPDNDCDGIEDEDYMAPETVGKKYMQFASRQEAAAQLARFRNYLIQQQVKGIMMVDPSQMGKDLYGLVNYYVNEHPKQVAEIEAAGEACAPKNPSAITMAIMKKLQLDMVINDRGLQDFERKVEQGRRYGKSRIQVFEQYFSEYAPRIIPELRAAGVPEADLDKAGRQVMLEILAVADPYKQFASFQCKRDAAFHMDEEHPENKVRFTSGNPFKDTSVMKMNDVQTLHDEIAQFFDEKGRLLPGKEKEFTAWVLNHKVQTKEGAKTMAQEMQQQEARIKEIKVKRTAQLMVAQQIIGRFFALVRDQQAGRALQPEQVDIEFGLVRKNSADKWEINPESDFYKAWQATATKGTRTLEVRPGFTPPVPTPCAPEDNNIQQVFKQIVGADDVRFGVVTENGVLIETTAAYLQATMELIDNMASEGEAFNAVSIVKGLWEKGAIDEQVFNELMDKIIDAMFERFNESEQLAFNPNTGVFDIQSYGISPVASFIVGKNSAEIDYQASRKALLATIAEIQGVADSLAGYRNKVFDAQAKKEIRDKHVRIAELFFMLGDEARFNEASKVVCAVEDLPVLPGEEDIDHTCGKAVAAKK